MRRILAGLLIGAYFMAFTWRALLMYFSGDDVMNLYGYWTRPVAELITRKYTILDAVLPAFRRLDLPNVIRIFWIQSAPSLYLVLRQFLAQSLSGVCCSEENQRVGRKLALSRL